MYECQIQSAHSILAALLKNHGPSLKLMTEVESIINSRLLTVETTNDIGSEALFHTSTIMNTSMLVPSPGVFIRPDLYGRCYSQRVQHLVNLFWSQWRRVSYREINGA